MAAHVAQRVDVEAPVLEKGSELRVLSFNAFCRPPGIKNKENDWKSERLDYMATHEMHNFDIVGMQELFGTFSSRRGAFLKACATAGHGWYVTSPKPSWKFLIDGGLAITSKYEIVEAVWHPFAPGMHSDRLAEKGVLYAKIAVNAASNVYLHVFNAHTQSSYNDPVGSKSWKVRERQTNAMLEFIQEMTTEDTYPLLLMGDLNIDARKEMPENTSSAEYTAFIQQLREMRSTRGEHDPEPVGYNVYDLLYHFNDAAHPVTFGDATFRENNEVTPLETVFTKHHDYGTFQSLDYIFWLTRPSISSTAPTPHHKHHRQSSEKSKGRSTEASQMADSTMTPISAQVAKLLVQGHPFTQLSDHYGVQATFMLN